MYFVVANSRDIVIRLQCLTVGEASGCDYMYRSVTRLLGNEIANA